MTLNGLGELMTTVGLTVLLFGEWKDRPAARVVGKPFASLGFIVAAIGFGALESRYGNIVLGGLILGAIGAGVAGAPWMIPVGALMFTASDIAVVRDRFVAPGFANRLWGLPLYYAAQLIIAWSIMAVNG